MSNGYADITELHGRQIALIHRIIDGNIPPDCTADGWECWNFEPMPEGRKTKEPIRKMEYPKFKRRYKK